MTLNLTDLTSIIILLRSLSLSLGYFWFPKTEMVLDNNNLKASKRVRVTSQRVDPCEKHIVRDISEIQFKVYIDQILIPRCMMSRDDTW